MRRSGGGRLGRDRRFVAAVIAGIAIILLTAKVLSVQFMIWLAPGVLVLPGLLGTGFRISYLLALALTVGAFKYLLWFQADPMWAHATMLLLRNLILMSIAILAVRASVTLSRGPALEPAAA
jgi:hypothetical protein